MNDRRPVFDLVDLVVRDMDATLAFYRRLGLDIPESSVWRTASVGHHVDVHFPGGLGLHFDSEPLAQAFDAGWPKDAGKGTKAIIGFSVATRDAVDERYADLVAAGYAGRQAPYDAFWGARYAVVEDPDGNHVGLMSPIDPARKSPPPDL